MRHIIDEYKYFADKRFSTISGTLVYFLLMSVTPFLFWLTLIAGEVDLSYVVSHEIFAAAQPVIGYLQSAARNATGGAGVVLVLTTLWSSTNFFYHLRRSGEIIYELNANNDGLKLRAVSLFIVFCVIVAVALLTAIPVFSFSLLEGIMPKLFAEIISTSFLLLFAFIGAYFLNVFACPHKLSFADAMGGVLLTVTLWVIFAVGFTVYLKFASPQKLYGAIAAIIVFLLWAYFMVSSLVLGIIYNGRYAKPRMRKSLY